MHLIMSKFTFLVDFSTQTDGTKPAIHSDLKPHDPLTFYRNLNFFLQFKILPFYVKTTINNMLHSTQDVDIKFGMQGVLQVSKNSTEKVF